MYTIYIIIIIIIIIRCLSSVFLTGADARIPHRLPPFPSRKRAFIQLIIIIIIIIIIINIIMFYYYYYFYHYRLAVSRDCAQAPY